MKDEKEEGDVKRASDEERFVLIAFGSCPSCFYREISPVAWEPFGSMPPLGTYA